MRRQVAFDTENKHPFPLFLNLNSIQRVGFWALYQLPIMLVLGFHLFSPSDTQYHLSAGTNTRISLAPVPLFSSFQGHLHLWNPIPCLLIYFHNLLGSVILREKAWVQAWSTTSASIKQPIYFSRMLVLKHAGCMRPAADTTYLCHGACSPTTVLPSIKSMS